MPVDRVYFDQFGPGMVPDIPYGTQVRFARKGIGSLLPGSGGVGIYTLCWMGIEPGWNVLQPDGTEITLFPTLGDTMEVF